MIYTVTLNPSIDYIVRVDGLKLGDLNRMKEDFKLPGGKGINVSRILKRIDSQSDRMSTRLNSSHIATSRMPSSA